MRSSTDLESCKQVATAVRKKTSPINKVKGKKTREKLGSVGHDHYSSGLTSFVELQSRHWRLEKLDVHHGGAAGVSRGPAGGQACPQDQHRDLLS